MKRFQKVMSALLLIALTSTNLHATEIKKLNPQVESFISKADQFTAKSEYDKAIVQLETAGKLAPENSLIKRKLISLYQKQAEVLAQKGLTNQALALLEKMKTAMLSQDLSEKPTAAERHEDDKDILDPKLTKIKRFEASNDSEAARQAIGDEKARVLFTEAMENYRKKQYGLARGFILEGIKYHDKSPSVFEILGDIEYYSQNLESAKENYEKSYKLESNERVGEKLKKLMSEQQMEKKLAEYLDEHFIIRYDRSQKVPGSEIRGYLRESYRVISQDFGHYLNYKTVVILYGEKEYRSISQIPHWSGALFDGKIRIPFYQNNADVAKLQRLIQHELTHVFISDLSNNQAPIWLHEGLAEYEEGRIAPINIEMFLAAAHNGTLLGAPELLQGIIQETDQTRALLFYVESFMLAKDLIEKRQFYAIKQLLKELAHEAPFMDAFQKVYGTSFPEYLRKWQAEQKVKA